MIGPSGCGKSTFVRCLNRMHETIPEARATAHVQLAKSSVYNGTLSGADCAAASAWFFKSRIRFPPCRIYDNVAAGLKLNGFRNRRQLDEIVERSLHAVRRSGMK